MNLPNKSTLIALCLSLVAAALAGGCNTMKGLGEDTERAGEKIQQQATK